MDLKQPKQTLSRPKMDLKQTKNGPQADLKMDLKSFKEPKVG